jgi:hypothetical protein
MIMVIIISINNNNNSAKVKLSLCSNFTTLKCTGEWRLVPTILNLGTDGYVCPASCSDLFNPRETSPSYQ